MDEFPSRIDPADRILRHFSQPMAERLGESRLNRRMDLLFRPFSHPVAKTVGKGIPMASGVVKRRH
jgi:hypothetical protein